MVQIRSPVLGDADHVTASRALWDVDEKTVTGFSRQEPEADDIAGWK
jgi:hypothetical protein